MIVGGQPEVQSNPGLAPDVALRIFPLRIKFQYSQTSFKKTWKGQNHVSALLRRPYYVGLAFLGPNKLSAIERCLHYRSVGTERLDCISVLIATISKRTFFGFLLVGQTLDTLQNVLKLLPLNLCFHR